MERMETMEHKKTMESIASIESVFKIFPMHIRNEIQSACLSFRNLEEIRVRVGQPLLFMSGQTEGFFTRQPGYITGEKQRAYIVTPQDVGDMLVFISRYSLFAFEEEVRGGYITLEGGHRVGLSGQAVIHEGALQTLRNISYLNIRISHEVKGCAENMLPYLYRQPGRRQSGIYNTLLVSPPGRGKTTLLRDMIRLLSDGTNTHAGLKVSVVDERSEIAACCRGVPQNDVGMRTDVLDACPKSTGMMRLIRTMSPQVVAVDELGSKEDASAVAYAIHSGCSVLGSVHAYGLEEMLYKPILKEFVIQRYFDRYLVISQEEGQGRVYRMYDADRKPLC